MSVLFLSGCLKDPAKPLSMTYLKRCTLPENAPNYSVSMLRHLERYHLTVLQKSLNIKPTARSNAVCGVMWRNIYNPLAATFARCCGSDEWLRGRIFANRKMFVRQNARAHRYRKSTPPQFRPYRQRQSDGYSSIAGKSAPA